MSESSNSKMETVEKCLLCGSDDYSDVLNVPDRFNLSDGAVYQLVMCKQCELIFLNPRPTRDTISKFYDDEEYQPFLSTHENLSLSERVYALVRVMANRNKHKKISKLKRPGRILDIGCGTGEFLNVMKQGGWQTFGLEKDDSAVAFAKSAYGLHVKAGELIETDFEKKSFDVITMWHVLEHVYSPVDEMKQIKELLKDDGILLIALPNISSPDAKYYKNNWVALDAPRHLTHFDKKSMTDLCDRTGFSLTETSQLIQDAFFNCFMSEKIIADKAKKGQFFLLLYAIRALYISLKTIYLSSGFSHKYFGSSTLYIIKKA